MSSNDKEEDDLVKDLIKAVYQREPLWNSTLSHEKRPHKVTSSLWAEVDQMLNLSSGESQAKFKNLRDRYVRLASEKKLHKESEASEPPQWKYYEQLTFLKPTITYRTSCSSVKRKERSVSPIENSNPKVLKIENSESTSNVKLQDNQYSPISKKGRNSENLNVGGMSPFELYCMKQMEILNKPADKISTFCAYLEAELRTLSDQKVENVKENILYLLLQAKKGYIK